MSLSQKSTQGAPLSDNNGGRAPWSAATLAALKALTAVDPNRTHGNDAIVDADGSHWVFNKDSALTGDDILVATPDAGSGRWLRKPGAVALWLPISYQTANSAVLLTIPTNAVFKLDSAHWRVTTGFSGGSSSAIGVSSTGNTTPGDILGGASGDVTATLGTAGSKSGTIGAKMDTVSELHAQLYVATNTFSFNRITSVFTAGAGYVVLVGNLISNPGA